MACWALSDGRSASSPAKLSVTGRGPSPTVTGLMEQAAVPAALVTAVQLWAVLPEPSDMVTLLPGNGVPLVALVSVDDKAGRW
ncbi:hypothetical protein [Kutzneria buriramensis]|uniref:Uncharacterized protein n=1 Tax=Kutzneria buriramensis TaxID=1045776 RepID=A0A3E0GYM3_9PSEU|nr:hypothetical protein [Kutzneria buriramensis]REH34776.1 hypothetical protein BCF44_11952 [Kutzneria buriramensis]